MYTVLFYNLSLTMHMWSGSFVPRILLPKTTQSHRLVPGTCLVPRRCVILCDLWHTSRNEGFLRNWCLFTLWLYSSNPVRPPHLFLTYLSRFWVARTSNLSQIHYMCRVIRLTPFLTLGSTVRLSNSELRHFKIYTPRRNFTRCM